MFWPRSKMWRTFRKSPRTSGSAIGRSSSMRLTVGPLVATSAAPVVGQHLHAQPAFVVETRPIPAGHLQARVVGLAHQQVALENRAELMLPGAIGGDRHLLAIGQCHLELRQQPRRDRRSSGDAPSRHGRRPNHRRGSRRSRCRPRAAGPSRRRPGTARAYRNRSSPASSTSSPTRWPLIEHSYTPSAVTYSRAEVTARRQAERLAQIRRRHGRARAAAQRGADPLAPSNRRA